MIGSGFGVGLYLLILGLIVVACLRYFVPSDDRRFVTLLLIVVLPVHFAVLWIFNKSTPFVPSETDAVFYYNYSMRVFGTVGDYFNLQATRDASNGFSGTSFTHLLTIINQLVGDSLLLRKFLSVAALWVMAFAWYGVARLAGGRRFAKMVLICIVLLPTLWYPFCILYRDELTSALHSVFFASLLLLVYGTGTDLISNIVVASGATLLLFLLRPGTIYINGAIAVAVMAGSVLARNKSKVARYSAVAGICSMAVYVIVSRANLLEVLHVEDKITLSALAEQGEESAVNAPPTIAGRIERMVPLFLISETTIVSTELSLGDPEQYRGIMNGPWVLLGVPFAALGIVGILKYVVRQRALMLVGRMRNRQAPSLVVVTEPNAAAIGVSSAIVGYCLIWLMVTIYMWDWTRWRLPAAPALALVAVWGFRRTSVGGRAIAMGGWLLLLTCYRLVLA